MKTKLALLAVVLAMITSLGCGVSIWRRHPKNITVAQAAPDAVYVAQDPSSTIGADKKDEPKLLHVSENGSWLAIGKIFNYCGNPRSIRTSHVEVCIGSELRYDRPPPDDLCWKKPGTFDSVMVTNGGQTPWLRVRTNGGFVPFKVDSAQRGEWSGVTTEQILLPIDAWGGDVWCPGNQLMDFVAEMCHPQPQQMVCRSTRLMR